MSGSASRFQDRLHTLCRLRPGRVAFPESSDPRILAAACQLLKESCAASVTLFGDPSAIALVAKQQALPLNRYEKQIVWAGQQLPDLAESTTAHIQARLALRGKSIAADEALRLGQSPLDQAAYLLSKDHLDAVVAGCTHTTADVIKAALRGVGTAPGSRTLSGSFAMLRESAEGKDKRSQHSYMFGDCGVVVEPDAEQLVDIAAATVETFQSLFPDLEPQLAFLSFSTKGSAAHPQAEKMRKAAELFQTRCPQISADGELQFDAAFDGLVAQRKAPQSRVAGRANCFIFPNLDAGNIAYKICQRLADFDAYGPILQGTAKPYTDLSRGASVGDIVMSSLIAMMRAKPNHS